MHRVLVALALVVLPAVARAELPPLIPRELLNTNPEKTNPELSPDGQRLAYFAPDKAAVLQVWVRTLGRDDDKPVTADASRGIRWFRWAEDGRTLFFLQDAQGDENFHLYGVDVATGRVRDLTPHAGVNASLVDLSASRPNEALVSLNLRDRGLADVYRLDLRTGALALDTKNPGDVSVWTADASLRVRGALAQRPDGTTELRVRASGKAPWRTLVRAGVEDSFTVELLGFSPDGRSAYLASSLGADTQRLVEKDLATGAERVLAEDPRVDLGSDDVLLHPVRRTIQAVSVQLGRREWKVLDPSIQADFGALAKQLDGEVSVVSRDRADTTWLVAQNSDRAPRRYYTFDRKTKQASLLFSTAPKLEGLALAEMRFVSIPARDGLALPCYLTLPVGVPPRGLPLVVSLHGGPWDRDAWGLRRDVQLLANRGYAVLLVNFRGSAGFGKRFTNAGDKQWGLKMHEDVLDAVAWVVKQGVADPKRVAIMGGSYGGYAALVAAVESPDVFRAAVDSSGPSNLFTLIAAIPPQLETWKGIFYKRVGNPNDPTDAARLRRTSPLFSADRIRVPLLIVHGAHDPRVKQEEAEQIFEALRKAGKRATYVLYTDEGHGYHRPENRNDFGMRVEAFLAELLGGRAEPLAGERAPGSSAVVRVSGQRAVGAAAK